MLKRNMIYTVNLRTTPQYTVGQRIISMPDKNEGTEWFEAPEPGWSGMTAHIGGLHLAQLRIVERLAIQIGDTAFARQCADWIRAGAEAMEKWLWTGGYYLNYFEPETGKKSDLVFGYQLDGEWVTDHHGLPSALPKDHVRSILQTIKRCNIAVTKYGAVNYANADGTPAGVKGYGTYSYFPPEALMLAMNYMYEGQVEFGLELARKVWHNLVCCPRLHLGHAQHHAWGCRYRRANIRQRLLPGHDALVVARRNRRQRLRRTHATGRLG